MDDNSIFDKMIEMSMGMTVAREMSRMTEAAMTQNQQPRYNTPPPATAPVSVQIYASINNTQAGPFTESEVITLIQRGMITNETFVWKAGLPNWLPANQVPEVGKLLLLYSNK